MIQGDGWQEFAEAYSIKKSDVLIFKYNRHKCFEILLFDHANLCEKEVSYFVRKGQPRNSDGTDDSSGKETENSAEEFTDKNQEADDESVCKFGSRRKRNSGRTHGYDGDEGDDTSDEENVSAKDCNAPKKPASEGVRGVPSNISRKRKNSKVSCKTIIRKRKRQCIVTYKSNRRPITEAEKEKALEKAREAASQYLNSFFVIMRPSSVYKHFYMSIPKEWNPRNVFKKRQEVILRVKDKTWTCRVTFSKNNRGFEGGWKRFVFENFLEEFDVCLFVPITDSKGGRPVLNVSIFRVVPEIVHSSPVTPSNVEVQEISSDDGDDDFDYARRNRHRRKNSGVTCKSHYPGSDAHGRDPHEYELDESSDEEKSSTEEDSTPKKAATARVREVPSNFPQRRKHSIAGKTTLKENGEYCKSSARQVTEAEKKQALQKAKEAAAKFTNPLVEVMRPSSVHRRYFLSIPKDWKVRRKLRKDQEVILRVKENTWTCTFCLTSNNVGLLCGWKHFVPDNKLEEFDVCVFVPAEEQNGKFFLDVIIFRARPEVV